MDQLEGTLTGALARIDADLFDLTARLEASLDFPDEGFHFITREQLQQEIWRTGRDISALTSQGRAGRVVREGRIVAILGRPNAGKSSLFNALVGAARAIVTDIPGTTRDMLSERVDIDGMAVTLVDTAGLREAGDAIEAEGVARARQAQQVAALSLVIVDGAAPLAAEDRRLAGADPARTLVVVSKSDLPAAWPRHEIGDRALEISALTGAGLDELRRRLGVALTGREELRDPPCISNARHLALLDEARRSVDRAAEALASGATEELILVDLGAARRALEEITGRRSPDDLLAHIFSRFCVGK
jgi:tRNA modification GTPase